MKKLFAVLAVAAIFTACNDADNKAAAEADSARAAATADSLAAINAMTDTTSRPMMMDTSRMMMDTSMKAVDTMKRN